MRSKKCKAIRIVATPCCPTLISLAWSIINAAYHSACLPSYIPMISISFLFVKMKGNVDLRSVNFESA